MSDRTYQILYCSRNHIRGTDAEVNAGIQSILRSSRANNAKAGVTGALFYNAVFFAQVLEGRFVDVQATFERLQMDTRHSDLVVLQSGYVAARDFPGWSMAFAETSAQVELPLQSAETDLPVLQASAEQISSLLRGVVLQQENWALPARTAVSR